MTGRVTIYSLVFHMTLTIFYNFYKWFRVVGPLNATEYGHMSCERKKKKAVITKMLAEYYLRQ